MKEHLTSAALTFVTTFLFTAALAIQVPDFSFKKESLVALAFSALYAAVRAVAKVIVEWTQKNIA